MILSVLLSKHGRIKAKTHDKLMILQRYIVRELVQAFLLIFFILFAVIMLTGPFFKFYKEYQNVGAGFLADVLPYFIPQAASFIIPLAMLIASVFVFGRFSEDNEIMAIRCSGIYLGRIILPVIFFGLGLSILVMWLNVSVIPEAQSSTRLITVNTVKNKIISPGLINRTIKLSREYQIYYNDIQENILKDVSVAQLDKNGELYLHMKAREGVLDFNEENSELTLNLKRVTQITWEGEGKEKEPRVLPDSASLTSVLNIAGVFVPKPKNLSAMSLKELNKMVREGDDKRFRISEILTEKHRRFAIGFTPLLFLLIGMPIGIMINKGSKVAGLGISAIIVFLGYYPLFVFTNQMGATDKILPQLAVWLPNAVLLIVSLIFGYIVFRK